MSAPHPSGRQNPSPDVSEQLQQQHAITVRHTSPRTEPADYSHNIWFSVRIIILLLLIGEDERVRTRQSQRNWNKVALSGFFVPDLEYSCVKSIYYANRMCLDYTRGSFNRKLDTKKRKYIKNLALMIEEQTSNFYV